MYLTTLRIINAADRTESVIDGHSILHIPRGIDEQRMSSYNWRRPVLCDVGIVHYDTSYWRIVLLQRS